MFESRQVLLPQCCAPVHEVLQPPQLASSLVMSMQLPPQ
jgi:hypothetical protein